MEENTTSHRHYRDEVPEDVRQHVRAARQELRESMRAFLPPGFWEHRNKARKEVLLAWRSMIDAALNRIDEKDETI